MQDVINKDSRHQDNEAPHKIKQREMKRLTTEVKQQLDWRRNKVLELSSQGYSEREISETIKVSDTTVHRDLVYLRDQAKENLQKHIHETVPEEYQKCMVGMKRNLKQTLEIAETTADPKTKLQARAIANDCYKYIMDLTTNGVVVTDAIKYVQGKIDYLNKTEKVLLQDIKEDIKEDKEQVNMEQQKAYNGIF
jgi:transposase